MKKKIISIMLGTLIFASTLAGCGNILSSQAYTTPTPEMTTTNKSDHLNLDENIIQDMAHAVDIFSKQCKDSSDNIILDESNLDNSYTLLAESFKEDSTAFTDLVNELTKRNKDLDSIKKRLNSNSHIITSNTIWSNKGFVFIPSYTNHVLSTNDCDTHELDFNDESSIDIINGWINKKLESNKTILNHNTLIKNDLLMINASHYKYRWYKGFDAVKENIIFNKSHKDNEKVDMMYEYGLDILYENDYAKGFAKLFEDKKTLFLGILPNEEGSFNVEDLHIAELFNNPVYDYEVNIGMPKCTLYDTISIHNTLFDNNISSIFTTNVNGTVCDSDVSFTDIIHHTAIDLDDAGSVTNDLTQSANHKFKNVLPIVFNRPFVFVIYDTETNKILSIGKINTIKKG